MHLQSTAIHKFCFAAVANRSNTGTGGIRALLVLLSAAFLSHPALCVDSKDTISDAWQEVSYLNYKGAARAFERHRDRAASGSDEWFEATMGLALALQHRQPDARNDKERAAELYDAVIGMASGNPVQAPALLFRARLADQVDYFGDQPDSVSARGFYDKLIRLWPESLYAQQAALYRAQLGIFSMDRRQTERACRQLRDWLKRFPDNALASLQWMLIGHAHVRPLGEPKKAVLAYMAAEKAGLPAQMKRDVFYWRIANLAEKFGDRKTALAYYRRIILEEQRSNFGYESQLRIRDLGETPPPLYDPFTEGADRSTAGGGQMP